MPDGLTAIPQLSGLPVPSHQVTQTGPGWTAIAPQETIVTGNSALGPGEALTLNAAGGMAFAIYGIAGFDGDNGPTSARITLSSLTGEYFVGFSDYIAGTWRFAGPFTGDATAEIPLPGGGDSSEYLSPNAFTSAAGTCYFVVAIPAGGLLTITGTELGVHGGVQAPQMTFIDSIGGGDAGCLITWLPSVSEHDPDFMGYQLERAPLLNGDYAPLGPGVIKGQSFLDDTVVMDVTYRYRLAAVDASGNQSQWATGTGQAVTGTLTDPVAVIKLPRGPLSSPAQVTLDLSESYDPAGVGITDYKFTFLMYPGNVNGASPTQTLTLPPGCHIISGEVTTADARTNSTYAFLKVYPSWPDNPSVVATTDPASTNPRLGSVRGMLQPGVNRPVFFGTDHTSYSCTFWYEDATSNYVPCRLPLIAGALNLSEPVAAQGVVYVSLATNSTFQVAAFENGEARWLNLDIPAPPSIVSALATDPSGKVLMFAAQDHGGPIDVTALDLENTSAYQVIAPGIAGMLAIDAIYNIASNCYDIVYSTPLTTEWVRWDPVTNLVTASSTVSANPSLRIDIERHAVTGRAALALYDLPSSRWVYTELDAFLAWIPGEIIDNSAINSVPADLAFGNNGNPFIYFATAPGQSNLHERTGVATWTARNTPVYALTSGFEAVAINVPNTDDFLTVDRVAGEILIGRASAGPTETLVDTFAPYQGLLSNIQGAAGTVDTTQNGAEQLHLMFSDAIGSSGFHYVSTSGGSNWVMKPATSFIDFDMAATQDGGVYVSTRIPANHQLHFWDPVADLFSLYAAAPIVGQQFSFISAGMYSPIVRWISYDGAANATYTTGYWGVAPSSTSNPAQTTPLWTGTGDATGVNSVYAVFAGGANINAAKFYWGTGTSGDLNLVSDSLAAELLTAYDESAVKMKQSAGAAYATSSELFGIFVPDTAIWTTYGLLSNAQRVCISLSTTSTTTSLPMEIDLSRREFRRTATAASGAGMTGIGMVSSFDGAQAYFEWSNYGDWETLPLPPALAQAINPELFIGRDGRWHIAYYDWPTDRVLCLSSL